MDRTQVTISSSSAQRLLRVPSHLRIKVIYSDADIVVINKPSLLRSVPGNRKNRESDAIGRTTNGHQSADLDPSSPQTSPQNTKKKKHNAPSTNKPIHSNGKHISHDAMCQYGQGTNSQRPFQGLSAQQAWANAIIYYRDNQDFIEQIVEKYTLCDTHGGTSFREEKREEQEPDRKGNPRHMMENNSCVTMSIDKLVAEEVSMSKLKTSVKNILRNIALSTGDVNSIPRKYAKFKRYCVRNFRTILPAYKRMFRRIDSNGLTQTENICTEPGIEINGEKENAVDTSDSIRQESVEQASRIAFEILRYKSNSFNMLDANKTIEEDSALGQLNLLSNTILHSTTEIVEDSYQMSTREKVIESFGALVPLVGRQQQHEYRDPIQVVHRLDCETSGVMVFARNEHAAGELSKAWRKRKLETTTAAATTGSTSAKYRIIPGAVTKVYLARVKCWPPYHDGGQVEGVIDLPLAAMENERLKWHVRDENLGGKASVTLWRVLNTEVAVELDDELVDRGDAVILELKPISGRTHQLRVHCAAVGSGIEGDSLYGYEPAEVPALTWNVERSACRDPPPLSLRLHSYRLSIPHPSTGYKMDFQCEHRWNKP